MKRASRIVETVKTVVLIILVISMAVLASVYILGTQRERINFGKDIVFDRLVALRSGSSEGADAFSHGQITPEIIGIKREGYAPCAMMTGSGYISDMYEGVMPYITEFFGSDAHCAEHSEKDGERLWKECMSSESYVYVRYHSEFPFSVLYVHSKNTDDADIYRSQKDVEGYVYELFLCRSGSALFVVTRDMRGRVLEFTSEKTALTELPSFGMYISRCEEFCFANDEYEDSAVFFGTPLFTKNIAVKKLISDNRANAEFEITSEKFRDLMRIFNFNPDKLSAYVDSEERGGSMYVESHGVLEVSESSIGYTAASDGGIPISDFLNYTDAAGYNLYDALKATEFFANRIRALSPDSFGGDASIGISDIGYRDGILEVDFSYYYENILVECAGESAAMKFEIDGDKFVGITLRPFSVSPSGESVQSFSQKMLIDMYEGKLDVPTEHLNMRMKYVFDGTLREETGADWEIVAY